MGMIDLIVKRGDNGVWKDGMIVDFITNSNEEYSDNMKETYLLMSVPNSWALGILQALQGEGDEDLPGYIPRKGKINLTTFSNNTGIPPGLINNPSKIERVIAQVHGIQQNIIEIT